MVATAIRIADQLKLAWKAPLEPRPARMPAALSTARQTLSALLTTTMDTAAAGMVTRATLTAEPDVRRIL